MKSNFRLTLVCAAIAIAFSGNVCAGTKIVCKPNKGCEFQEDETVVTPAAASASEKPSVAATDKTAPPVADGMPPTGLQASKPGEAGNHEASDVRQNANSRAKTHVVKAGETLYRVAVNHGMTLSQLAAINGLRLDTHVYTGQVLFLSKPPAEKRTTVTGGKGVSVIKEAVADDLPQKTDVSAVPEGAQVVRAQVPPALSAGFNTPAKNTGTDAQSSAPMQGIATAQGFIPAAQPAQAGLSLTEGRAMLAARDATPPEGRPAQRPRPSVKLPGVGQIKGDDAMFNANVISVRPDRTEVVYISKNFPNRIATPFSVPKMIGADIQDLVTQVGSSLYVQPGVQNPLGVFITGSSPGDPVISITLVPKDMPQQTVSLLLDSTTDAGKRPKSKDGSGDSYTNRLVNLLREVASGRAPAGFSEGALPNAIGRMGNLLVMPEMRYSGHDMDIFKYRIENKGPSALEINEADFYQEGVLAVSAFPNVRLNPGGATFVFIVADKSAVEISNTKFLGE